MARGSYGGEGEGRRGNEENVETKVVDGEEIVVWEEEEEGREGESSGKERERYMI